MSTTVSFASSAGWPMRTPPMVSHPFTLAAVPAPDPKSSVTTRRTMLRMYRYTVIHSTRRTDARKSMYPAPSDSTNHPS